MSNTIWIDNGENDQYLKQLRSLGLPSFTLFKEVDKSIEQIKNIKFQEIKVIISGELYFEFVKKFKEKITDMCVAPKIIIFTKNKKNIEDNIEYRNNINSFYKFGRIATTIEEIKKFLENEIKPRKIQKTEGDNLFTFDYIDSLEKLALPIFFKCLIDNASKDETTEYINSLYDTYSEENNELKILLDSIKSFENIPTEILSKYYARIYTADSSFHKNINNDLGLNKKEKYLSFIKTLYEGVKLKSLPLASKKYRSLYRGSKIRNEEVTKIKSYLNKKNNNLPRVIAFSKSFLSFSKDKKIAERFLSKENKDKNLISKVLYILEKDDNIGYNLSTHADIEDISFFTEEQEVLFFPFSSFEIKEIKEIIIGKEKGYEIKLLYLGKYLKEIEKNENIMNIENKIPDSEFKKELSEFGLIKKEKIKNINTKILYKDYKKYEKEIKKNNNKNVIIGEINITKDDINKDIQIINSFENFKRNTYTYMQDKEDDHNYENEKEIKENIEIRIDGKEIKFSYLYKFNKEGKHQIEYSFKKDLSRTNHMFYNCKSLTNLDLLSFNTQSVTDMNHMFSDCKSLKNLDLSFFNTQNVTNMNHMFSDCKSLSTLDLSSFNTQSVTDMSGMFSNCKSLTNLDLSNFNTQSATDMSYMFSCCKELTKLDLSNFNTQKVTNMEHMFSDCESLTNLDLSNFNTSYVINMNYMFSDCKSLTNLDLSNFNTQSATDMSYMFYSCEKLKSLNISNFNTIKVKNMNNMFSCCKELTNLNLSNFKTHNVTNMNHMFNQCEKLKILNLSNFHTQNVTYMNGMFYGCKSLTKLDLSNFKSQNYTNMNNIFKNCKNLKQKNITTKDNNILNKIDN